MLKVSIKNLSKNIIIFSAAALVFTFSFKKANADICQPVYGGGQICQPVVIIVTPVVPPPIVKIVPPVQAVQPPVKVIVPVTPTPKPGAAKGAPPITKGGLPVAPAPSVTTTPPTGPEALSLLALLPTGIVGFLLQKKAQVS